jgi:chemotaxis protein histidine kinase CheA
MSTNHELRSGFKWTVNECLRLQREFELLNLSVEEIALLHQRSPYAIMYKLDAEDIADFNELYQQTYPNQEASAVDGEESDAEKEEDEESEAEESEADESEADAEEEQESEEESDEEDYDRYNMKQQVRILTKQLSNLTAVVYKFVTGPNSVKHRSAF